MCRECESYNGWPNRETWGANLWLSNDSGLHDLACEWVRDVVNETSAVGNLLCVQVGEHVVNMLRDLCDEFPSELGNVRDDVGSWWRVDFRALGRSWVATVAELDEWSDDDMAYRGVA